MNKTCEIIKLPISRKTERMLSRKLDLGKDMFSEKGWPGIAERELIPRASGYMEMPELDLRTGSPIRFKNKISDTLYGKAHVYSIDPEIGPEHVIIYLHGGGYVFNAEGAHARICDWLCTGLNAKVIMPFYNLAPQGNYREAYELLNEVYQDVLKHGKPVTFMGDSAGGGLALGFAMDLKETGKKLPDRLVLFSPWVDLGMENPDIDKYEEIDPMLSKWGLYQIKEWWADGDDAKDYRVSPLFGDVKDLPPVMIITGTAEILYPDNLLLYNKFREADGDCRFVVAEGLFHAFPVISGVLEESQRSLEMAAEFIRG